LLSKLAQLFSVDEMLAGWVPRGHCRSVEALSRKGSVLALAAAAHMGAGVFTTVAFLTKATYYSLKLPELKRARPDAR